MFSRTPVRRIGTLSTVLANSALYLAHWAGLQTPAAALILAGCFFRCLILPSTIYGDQCLRRVACAYPELQDAHKYYLSIVDHPDAIAWEKRVAAQKLKNDRERIFRSHRTNNVKMFVPHVVGAAASLYSLCVPAQQIGTFFIQDAGMAIVSPLAVSYVAPDSAAAAGKLVWTSTLAPTTAAAAATSTTASTAILFTLDPTIVIASGLTCFNVVQHLRQRTGFNTRLDRWIGNVQRAALVSCAIVAAGSFLSGPLSYVLAVPTIHFFPPYLGPVWLGMSATTTVKNLLVNNTAPGRALFKLPDYPPQHGTYGEESTAAGHEYRLAFTGVDVEETRHAWQTQKRILDYECDVRIHAWLSRLGIFNELDELAYEAEQLQKKRAVAHQRRLAREAASPPSPSAGGHTASPPLDGTTQAARRRQEMRQEAAASARMAANGESLSEEAVVAEVERIQEAEYRRRQELKAARMAAWKKNHHQQAK